MAGNTTRLGLHIAGQPSIAYIPQHAILERANTTLRYPVPFIDPKTGELWGNFPQTYSHVGLINAAFALSRRDGRPLDTLLRTSNGKQGG